MPTNPRPTKAIGRKRRTLGWTLLTLGLLVAAVWVWSGWYELDVTTGSDSCNFSLTQGVVLYGGVDPATPPWSTEVRAITRPTGLSSTPSWCWRATGLLWINWQSTALKVSDLYFAASADLSGTLLFVALVIWPFPVLLFGMGVPLLRSGARARRRVMTIACAKCGYDLSGLAADAPCPECGKAKA